MTDNQLEPDEQSAPVELRPCPFCGGEAQYIETPSGNGNVVQCDECGADGPYDSGSDYAELWNARPVEDGLRAELGAAYLRIEELMDQLLSPRCVWTHDPSDVWSSDCGFEWGFVDHGGPIENDFKFCPGCGNPVFVPPERE